MWARFFAYALLPVPIACIFLVLYMFLKSFDDGKDALSEVIYLIGLGYMFMGVQSLLYASIMRAFSGKADLIKIGLTSTILGAFSGLTLNMMLNSQQSLFIVWGALTGLVTAAIVEWSSKPLKATAD